ncbi:MULTISPECIES: lipopolysaccharide biosynthesis protein [unclassified Myroides]|uniref:lipopolysaccharide biosynthesis protein n=1 Tax=unclassified Myroides TaxID=2642485 RepID=UPI003D2F534E
MGNGISTKQAFLFTLINYIGVLIGVVSTVLIYPQDKEMLGIIRFVDACAQIMYPIIALGSTHALINFYPQLTEKLQQKLFSYSLLSLAKLAVWVGVALVVIRLFNRDSSFTYVLYAFPLAIAMAYIELFRRQATNLQKISFPTFFEKIIPKIALPSIFLLAIYTSMTLDQGLVFYILSYGVITVVIGSYIYKLYPYKLSKHYDDLFDQVKKKDYYAYSLFAFAGSFGSFFAFRVDSLMIPYFISYEANGTYTIGVTLASTLAIPATGVFALYAPVISDLIKNVQLKKLNEKYKEVARVMFFIGMLLFSCVAVGIEPLFKLLPTYEKLAPSLPIIYLLGINGVINMSTGFNSEIISYSKYYRFNLSSILFLMVLNVGMNYWFLTQTTYGILGVGLASLLSLTLFNLGKVIYIYLKMRLWPFDLQFGKLFGCMLFILGVGFCIPVLNDSNLLTLCVRVGFVLICGILVVFKTPWVSLIQQRFLTFIKRYWH